MAQEAYYSSTNPSRLTLAFSKTIHYLYLHPPTTIIVPENALASSLSRPGAKTFRNNRTSKNDEPSTLVTFMEARTGVRCQAMPRSSWNREEGSYEVYRSEEGDVWLRRYHAGFSVIQDFCVDDGKKTAVIMTMDSK
jgi:hypothetical protein